MSLRNAITLVSVTVGFVGMTHVHADYHAWQPGGGEFPGGGCFEETLVADPLDPRCVHSLMSLTCIDTDSPDSDGGRPGDAQCGVKRIWWIILVACGRPAIESVCIGDTVPS